MNGKANSEHTHDDRYYTESEIDNKFNQLNSNLVNNELFEIVGESSGFTKTDYCIYNIGTKHVKIICDCVCNPLERNKVLCRVPQKYFPLNRVPALIHEINGQEISQVDGLALHVDGNIYQSLSNGLTSVTFEMDYYI